MKKENSLIKKHKIVLKACAKRLGITFSNKLFLLKSLCHKSYSAELLVSNERLEFLGDAVLGMIITEYLFITHPEKDEGVLTHIRSKLIRKETLSTLAQGLSLGDFIFIGENEKKIKTHRNRAILANTLEAIIGAYFLDQQYKKTKIFVLKLFSSLLTQELHDLPIFEYKNKLQEHTQAHLGVIPHYKIVSTEGPDHNKLFTAQVLIQETISGIGKGKTKKEAETLAAKEALKKLGVKPKK
ncbi:ribonuclease III [Chlamydiota bacterium]